MQAANLATEIGNNLLSDAEALGVEIVGDQESGHTG